MKSNIVKYIFIIFIIAIIIAVIYQVNQENEIETEGKDTITDEEELVKEIHLGIAEFDTMNPILSENKYVQEISKIIFEPLLELDQEYKLKKCLAKDWAKTSETTYLVKIRDDIKWSDGTLVLVEDVIFTIETLKNVQSIYTDNVKYVTNVEKVDIDTIQITLGHEVPFFEYNLLFPIINRTYYEGQNFLTTEKNNLPIGTGKYKITQNTSNVIILDKNEYYSREDLTLEKITIYKYENLTELYNAFKLGRIDILTSTNTEIENYIGTIGYNKQEIAGREFDFLVFNTQNTVLSNKEVRNAITYAINRENIVESLFKSKYVVMDYPLDYGNWLQGDNADISYNPEIAQKILQDNGWEYKYNKWQKTENYYTRILSFKIVVQASNQTRNSVAEMIKADLENIGINVTIIKASDSEYKKYLQNKNYDSIITGTTLALNPDLETYFGISNYSNFDNEELKILINEVKNITKDELLKEKYFRIREIFNEQTPYIGLYSSYYTVASSWALIGNITSNWYNIFIDINNWYKN